MGSIQCFASNTELHHFWPPPKIMLAGPPHSGKTSIIRQFAEQRFNIAQKPTTTIHQETAVLALSDGQRVCLTLIDTPGCIETFKNSVTTESLVEVDAVLLCSTPDTTSLEYEEHIRSLKSSHHFHNKRTRLYTLNTTLQLKECEELHSPCDDGTYQFLTSLRTKSDIDRIFRVIVSDILKKKDEPQNKLLSLNFSLEITKSFILETHCASKREKELLEFLQQVTGCSIGYMPKK